MIWIVKIPCWETVARVASNLHFPSQKVSNGAFHVGISKEKRHIAEKESSILKTSG